ncbi:MAG: helix-turn-helix domain-containing protein, partial [Candidatus Taylorbacteria bacterium]|nr:helix-turn-helix domain-containing protein [Candidatus Taylorbacteria bacterium]
WDFLKSVRAEKSKKLLSDSACTEQQVALEVGFGNVTTFRRAFKNAFGESPAQYRKRVKGKVSYQD